MEYFVNSLIEHLKSCDTSKLDDQSKEQLTQSIVQYFISIYAISNMNDEERNKLIKNVIEQSLPGVEV